MYARSFFIAPLLAALSLGALAQEGCQRFGWPMESELSWMASPTTTTIESGAALTGVPHHAIALRLQPSQQVALPVKPGAKKQVIAPSSYSGWVTLESVPKAGLYQVSLSHDGWIDVVQNGELVQSAAFTGNRDCPILRKSVRFELSTGKVTVQIAGAPAPTVKIAIREVN